MSDTTQADSHHMIDPERTRTALLFFKVMAILTGLGLLLVCAEVVLHYGFDSEALMWWLQPHGVIYIIYAISTANLGFKVRWGLPKMALVMLAGWVPFVSFVAERKVEHEVRGLLDTVEA